MKDYKFQFSSKAELNFANLPHDIQTRVLNKLFFFEKSQKPLHFAKRLHGTEETYRFRIGDYRVIVMPKDKNVIVILLILKIGHRREVYE